MKNKICITLFYINLNLDFLFEEIILINNEIFNFFYFNKIQKKKAILYINKLNYDELRY